MKNKGFTLAELLGVIAILALICLVAFPPMLEAIKKSKKNINDTNSTIVLNAANLYVENNINSISFTNNKYCFQIQTLIDSGELAIDIEETSGGKIKATDYIKVDRDGNNYNYKITKTNEC